jgi:hypothetical protein
VLLFVALQSFPLIAFTEINFLMLRRRAAVAALIFGVASLANLALVELLSGSLAFEVIMMISIIVDGLAMMAVMKYAALLGFDAAHPGIKVGSAGALLLLAVVYHFFGLYLALPCALVFLVTVVKSNWQVLRPA